MKTGKLARFFTVALPLIGACASSPTGTGSRGIASEQKTSIVLDCAKIADVDDQRFCALVEQAAAATLGLMVERRMFDLEFSREIVARPGSDSFGRRSGSETSSSLGFRDGSGADSLPGVTSAIAGHVAFGTGILILALASNEFDPAKIEWLLAKTSLKRQWSFIFGVNTATITLPAAVAVEWSGAVTGSVSSHDFAGSSVSNSLVASEKIDEGIRRRELAVLGVIRRTALDIANGAAALLRLSTSERLKLGTEIRLALLREIENRANGEVSTVKIDLLRMPTLRARGVGVNIWVREIHRMLVGAPPGTISFTAPDGRPRALEAMRAIEVELGKMVAYGITRHQELEAARDSRFENRARDFLAFAHDCEVLRAKVKAHLAMAVRTP